jgi:hypothetical protein
VAKAAPVEAQPFLKWVGGKAQLLAQFEPFLPKNWRGIRLRRLNARLGIFFMKAKLPGDDQNNDVIPKGFQSFSPVLRDDGALRRVRHRKSFLP